MNGTTVFNKIPQHFLVGSHSHLQVFSFNLSHLDSQSAFVFIQTQLSLSHFLSDPQFTQHQLVSSYRQDQWDSSQLFSLFFIKSHPGQKSNGAGYHSNSHFCPFKALKSVASPLNKNHLN